MKINYIVFNGTEARDRALDECIEVDVTPQGFREIRVNKPGQLTDVLDLIDEDYVVEERSTLVKIDWNELIGLQVPKAVGPIPQGRTPEEQAEYLEEVFDFVGGRYSFVMFDSPILGNVNKQQYPIIIGSVTVERLLN